MPHQTDRDQGDGEIAKPRPKKGKTSAQDCGAGRGKAALPPSARRCHRDLTSDPPEGCKVCATVWSAQVRL